MPGIIILLFLILISSVLAVAVFLWFKFARYPIPVWLFFCSLLAGATSFFPALLLHGLISAEGNLGVIIRALTEEISRIPLLIILFFIIRKNLFKESKSINVSSSESESDTAYNHIFSVLAASALVVGLGFTVLEGAVYSAANPDITLTRACTAAFIHAACASRVGYSVAVFRYRPISSFAQFLFAVLIHGVYNIMLLLPGSFSFIAAILLALSAFFSSVVKIRSGMKKV